MAQSEFTKAECEATKEAVEEVMKAFPKSKVLDFVGHFNDIFLFLGAVERHIEQENKDVK